MKLFVFASVFCFSTADIQNFIGVWTPALAFHRPLKTPACDGVNIALDSSTCVCNGSTVPVTSTTLQGFEALFGMPFVPVKIPTIVADSPEDVPNALSTICECDGRKSRSIVFRRINDNCFVMYDMLSGRKYTENEPNDAVLLVKTAPKTVRELEAVCKIEDLKDRTGYLICPSTFS